MFKNTIITLLAFAAVFTFSAKTLAENAAGLTLGGPTFIHFATELESKKYFEVGLSFSYKNSTHIYGDYLIYTNQVFNNPNLNDISLFYGVGGLIVINNKDRHEKDGYYAKDSGEVGFGVRFPLGLEWRGAKTQQIGVHLRLDPVIAIAPETEVGFMAGLGAKFYF